MSRARYLYTLAVPVALLIAPATEAADWWLVFAEGDKPQREVHYLDLASVDIVRDPSRLMSTSLDTKINDADLIDFIQVEGVAVYESAQSPAKAATQYRVKCRERTVAATMASQLWRHDRIEQLPDQGWTAIAGNALLSQIHAFICAQDKRDANNMLRVTDDYDPMPLTWTAFWPDGVEPQWTSTRTAEQINAEIDTKLAKTRELLAQGAAMASAGLQKIESDREQTIRDQQKLFSQMAQKASPVLHSWMGLQEASLVASWGVPHQSFESGGSRFLYYAYGYTTKLVDQNGFESGVETWACHMTFEVRDGLVADYRSHGNYCQTAAMNMPYGRPREQVNQDQSD
jgi:hypothetical protein